MSLDVFGRKLEGSQVSRGPPGIGFNLTEEGHFDLENKRLCNIQDPIQSYDAVNLNALKNILQSEIDFITSKIAEIAKVIQEYKNSVEKYQSEVDAKLDYLNKTTERNYSTIEYIIKELNDQTAYVKEVTVHKAGK